MGSGFSVDPASLRRSAGEMTAVGAALDPGQITANASSWGGDEEGAAFGAAYREVADAAHAALASITGELASVGDRLAAMAQTYEHIDEAAHDAFHHILSE